MIRSGTALVAVAIAVLVTGVIAGSLLVVYASIGVSILAAVLLATGVLLHRQEIFGTRDAAAGTVAAPVAARPAPRPAPSDGARAEPAVAVAAAALRPGELRQSQPAGPTLLGAAATRAVVAGAERDTHPETGTEAGPVSPAGAGAKPYTAPAPGTEASPVTPAGAGAKPGTGASPVIPAGAATASGTEAAGTTMDGAVAAEDGAAPDGTDAADSTGTGLDGEPAEPAASVTTAAGRPEAGPADSTPDVQVTIVPGVPRYHRRDCLLIRFLTDDDLETSTREAAEKSGCVPCKACRPAHPATATTT